MRAPPPVARRGSARDEESLYIVAYDIGSPRRWRKVFRIMEGYGEWVQLSVFQCRLTRRRQIELKLALEELINHAEDHVIIIEVGPTAQRPRIESLGKAFSIIDREPLIV
ncbi:MAG TPA: CRISPR-associated endonuclease Cas2 [Stellaceae bacterium]|nr:CRISPR-associated endonuclease Cas2 [Stellaceae bacterium]